MPRMSILRRDVLSLIADRDVGEEIPNRYTVDQFDELLTGFQLTAPCATRREQIMSLRQGTTLDAERKTPHLSKSELKQLATEYREWQRLDPLAACERLRAAKQRNASELGW